MSSNPNEPNYWSQNPGFQQQSYGDINFEMPVQQDFSQELWVHVHLNSLNFVNGLMIIVEGIRRELLSPIVRE